MRVRSRARSDAPPRAGPTLERRDEGDRATLLLSGQLRLDDGAWLAEETRRALAGGPRDVALDLSRVERTSDVAHGFYETRRWTEEPSVYLRRLLERALFEEGGRRRASPSRAPSLDVELTAFEEVTGEPPSARVALVVGLTDEEGQGLAQRTIEVTRVADGDDPEAVVTALGLALREAIDEVVRVADAQGPATK